MNLVGKTKEQIEKAIRHKKRHEIVEIIYGLASFEPFFKPQEIADRRRMSKGTVLELIKAGTLRAHKPSNNVVLVPLSAIHDWDRETALFFSSKHNEPNESPNE